MKEYYKRLVEEKINRKLKSSGAVLVTGPKFCGKTTTCKIFKKSMLQLIDTEIINIASADPKHALFGDYPRLIDEWQNVPELWNYIRKKVDDDSEFGEFILTGSTTPCDTNLIHHSGAGRISTVKMRSMSLYESRESKGIASISRMFDDPDYGIFDLNEDYELADTAYYICRGGWPMSVLADKNSALDVTEGYYEGLFNFKNSDNISFRTKKPEILRMLLKSYARHVSTPASYQTILNDIMLSNSRNIDAKTLQTYLDIANDLFIIEDMEAWSPTLRSKTTIRTTPTRHFVDTSIACRAMSVFPNDLMNDARTFGLFFEDFAVRDLRIYAESLNGEVRHYRDGNGLECDAILHLDDGRWAAIEIKLGGSSAIEEGAKNLLKLEGLLAEGMNKPSFKMVLTAVGRAYKRSDGIYVIPINCLKN